MQDLEFEWDEAKAASNLTKHAVSFDQACHVFADAFAVEYFDAVHAAEEQRFVITGMVNGTLLIVVYAERGHRIRIISARNATRQEQNEYYLSQTKQ